MASSRLSGLSWSRLRCAKEVERFKQNLGLPIDLNLKLNPKSGDMTPK